MTNSYVNNVDAPFYSVKLPTITRSISNSNEINFDQVQTAVCKGSIIPLIIQIHYDDYTKFALNFCETFNQRNNRGLPNESILDSLLIPFTNS